MGDEVEVDEAFDREVMRLAQIFDDNAPVFDRFVEIRG